MYNCANEKSRIVFMVIIKFSVLEKKKKHVNAYKQEEEKK